VEEWNWALVAEADRVVHRVVVYIRFLSHIGSFAFSLHLEVVATLATIILHTSSR
jgi:hypothetical protein